MTTTNGCWPGDQGICPYQCPYHQPPKIVNIGTSIMVRRLSLSGSAASYIDAKEREGWRAKSEVRKRGVRHKLVRR